MRVLIIGAAGQLGQDLVSVFSSETLHTPGHATLDVTDGNSVEAYLQEARPELVINTSAFHDVPRCEQESETAFSVNAVGPLNLARSSERVGARFIHVSTDYVFDGAAGRPYSEKDVAAPLMVYGASKLAGEHLALSSCSRAFMVRTTGLFGRHSCRAKPGGRNFVETMLHLAQTREDVSVIDDIRCNPTYTPDLANQIHRMAATDIQSGVYHAVSGGGCSWHDFAAKIFETAGVETRLLRVGRDAFPAPFSRPVDSRLRCLALEELGIYEMGSLDEALGKYFSASDHNQTPKSDQASSR